MTRDKRDSKNEGVLAVVLIFLSCFVYNGGRGVGKRAD